MFLYSQGETLGGDVGTRAQGKRATRTGYRVPVVLYTKVLHNRNYHLQATGNDTNLRVREPDSISSRPRLRWLRFTQIAPEYARSLSLTRPHLPMGLCASTPIVDEEAAARTLEIEKCARILSREPRITQYALLNLLPVERLRF